MNMRRSRVLEKLRAGENVSCFKLNLADARAAEIAAMVGFDCIWTDQEHTAGDWSALEQQVWATKSQNADLLVRISRGSYSDYVRPLELDASGIMVPHVMSLKDAEEVVHRTRFHPIGRRALDGGNADGLYATLPTADYLRQANAERFVILQIEDPEPMSELEAIAALDGYDMLFFGPGDFSHGLGFPGDFSHPEVLHARKRIADVCREYGKFAGTVGSPENAAELTAMGYQFLNLGADVIALSQYCQRLLAGFPSRSNA